MPNLLEGMGSVDSMAKADADVSRSPDKRMQKTPNTKKEGVDSPAFDDGAFHEPSSMNPKEKV